MRGRRRLKEKGKVSVEKKNQDGLSIVTKKKKNN